MILSIITVPLRVHTDGNAVVFRSPGPSGQDAQLGRQGAARNEMDIV